MARRRVRQHPTIERKIYFYRVNAGFDAAGQPIPYDPTPTLGRIHRLGWTPKGRYLVSTDGNLIACWVDRNRTPHRLRVANIRRDSLPHIESAGALTPLQLPVQSGLAEQTHVVFFEDNIVGAEFNFYGPRVSKLSHYFSSKARGIGPNPLTFEPLLRQDVAEQLQRYSDIRLLTLKLRPAHSAWLREANESLWRAFRAASQAGGAEEVEVTLKTQSHSRRFLPRRMLQVVRRLARRPEFRQEASRAIIKALDAETGRMDTVDLLNDKLIGKRAILQEDDRYRTVNRDSAFAAIEDVHQELREHLLNAAAIAIQ